jgi:uncharacterized protein YbgA (DUF1722 family)
MIDIITHYWPRFIVSLLFALYSMYIIKDRYSIEYEVIKTHSKYGDALLSHNESEIMTIARIIAYEHHERWDGKGYPRGLRGKEIRMKYAD